MPNDAANGEQSLRFREAGHLFVCEYSCPELEADVRIGSVLLTAYESSEVVREGFRKLMQEAFTAYALKIVSAMTATASEWK